MLDLLDEIRERLQVAILFVTHDLRVAARICHRVIVMQRGEVVGTGAERAAVGNPRQDYTKALLAAAPGARIKMWRPEPRTS